MASVSFECKLARYLNAYIWRFNALFRTTAIKRPRNVIFEMANWTIKRTRTLCYDNHKNLIAEDATYLNIKVVDSKIFIKTVSEV